MTLAEIKMNMNRQVYYNGNPYKLTACIFRQNEKTGNYYYQAELVDNNKSIVICKLEDVKDDIK